MHQLIGKNRIIVHRAAVIVLTRDVLGQRHRGHAGGAEHGGEIKRLNLSVCERTHAEGRVQRVGGQWDVVAIMGAAADVQRCAVMDGGCAGAHNASVVRTAQPAFMCWQIGRAHV